MLWILDGYNVLYAMGLLSDRRSGPHRLEKARLALLGRLAAALGEKASKAVVVFDAAGAPPGLANYEFHRGIRVHFARQKEQADDLIERLIHANASRSLTVVSNDQRLVKAARQRQCQTQSCEEFIAWLEKQRVRHAAHPEEPVEKSTGLPGSRVDPLLHELAGLDQDPSLGEELHFKELADEDPQ